MGRILIIVLVLVLVLDPSGAWTKIEDEEDYDLETWKPCTVYQKDKSLFRESSFYDTLMITDPKQTP